MLFENVDHFEEIPEASCIILTGSDRRQAVENRCTPQ